MTIITTETDITLLMKNKNNGMNREPAPLSTIVGVGIIYSVSTVSFTIGSQGLDKTNDHSLGVYQHFALERCATGFQCPGWFFKLESSSVASLGFTIR